MMIDQLKKNQSGISFLLGILLAIAAYTLNPFSLQPDACKAVAVALLMIIWWITEALPMPAVALANSLENAGVIQQIGNGLASFGHSGNFILVLVIVVISIFLSELMSNVAQVIVLTPVLAAMADVLHMDPLMLGLPMTLAASAAAMLPMGTPPNAIVFGSGLIRLKDMIKAGFIMNLVSIIVITLFTWFFLPVIMRVLT